MSKKTTILHTVIKVVATLSLLAVPHACLEEDSSSKGEQLAKRFCNCETLSTTDKKEACIDKVIDEASLYPASDEAFWRAYKATLNQCQN